MSNVLVTGGAGFLGSHTCLSLLERGHNVISFDSYINSYSNSLDKVKSYFQNSKNKLENNLFINKGDLRNFNDIDSLFFDFKRRGIEINSVIHFAGLKSIKESLDEPLRYWDFNVLSSVNLFKVLKNYNCKTIVFSSSAAVYNSICSPFSESSETFPKSAYGQTKLAVENILGNLFKSCPNQFKIANLRYFNPAGAHESGFIGEDPKGKTNNLFPIINKVAHGKINCLKVFGNDWETNDGTCVRDFIHVMDLVDAHISTMEYLNLNESQILNLNLGSGKGISIKDLIMIYEKTNNCIIPIEFHDRRRGDTSEVVADISKALSLLNWKPRKTLEDICRDAFNFEKNKQSIKY